MDSGSTLRVEKTARLQPVVKKTYVLDTNVLLHDPTAVHPAHAWRAKWTSPAVLDDERTLLAAAATPTRALANPNVVRVYLEVAVTGPEPAPHGTPRTTSTPTRRRRTGVRER